MPARTQRNQGSSKVPGRLRIVTDFDGVWTDVNGQAEAVDRHREEGLRDLSGWPGKRIRSLLEEVERAVRQSPHEYGWASNGRISAFADEDPFLFHNALLSAVDRLAAQSHPGCLALQRDLAAQGLADLNALGSRLFMEASQGYLSRCGHAFRPEAGEVLTEMLELGEVIFCTNFTTEAVAHSWARLGFFVDGPQATPGLAIRGLARKQELTADPPRQVSFGARQVAVDRGHYRQALLEERPDVVIGDVFSLDLALPLLLRSEHPDFLDLSSLLVQASYTPAWSLALCANPTLAGLCRCHDLPATLALLRQRTCG